MLPFALYAATNLRAGVNPGDSPPMNGSTTAAFMPGIASAAPGGTTTTNPQTVTHSSSLSGANTALHCAFCDNAAGKMNPPQPRALEVPHLTRDCPKDDMPVPCRKDLCKSLSLWHKMNGTACRQTHRLEAHLRGYSAVGQQRQGGQSFQQGSSGPIPGGFPHPKLNPTPGLQSPTLKGEGHSVGQGRPSV